MRIIFLDIDGVMVSDASCAKNKYKAPIHPEHAEALNHILEQTDARIVVTSTYRLMYTLKELKALFKRFGVPYKYVCSATPHLKKGWRGDEIQYWLDKVHFPVESYVVLDDGFDMLGLKDMTKFIQCNGKYGLTYLEANQAIRILNK